MIPILIMVVFPFIALSTVCYILYSIGYSRGIGKRKNADRTIENYKKMLVPTDILIKLQNKMELTNEQEEQLETALKARK